MSEPRTKVQRSLANELACATNARTVATFAYITPDARPPISVLLDAASRAARGIS